MEEIPQNFSQKKLPVWTTIREAFAFSWDHLHMLWGWIILGALLAGLVDLVNLYEYEEDSGGLTGLQYFMMILLTPIPSLLVFVLLAGYCHRTFLLYDGRKKIKLRFYFEGSDRKFFVWLIGVSLCALLLSIPVFVATFVIEDQIRAIYPGSFWENTVVAELFFNLGFLVPAYYLMGRWILVFPAIAIKQDARFGLSWKQTKGNSWRMFFLVGFLPMTVGNMWYLLSLMGLPEYPVFNSFLTSFSLFLFTPVEVAVISIAFRELTNWTPPSQLREST